MGVSQDHMIEKLLEYVPMLLGWVGEFMSHAPTPGRGEIEFRRSVIGSLHREVIKPGLDSGLDSGLDWTPTKLRAMSDNKKKCAALLH